MKSTDLAGRFYPGVPIRGEIEEHGSLVSNQKARTVLGFEPRFRWREQPSG
jgi:hypothetical protein